jgi:6-phosphogluconolactonase
VSAPDLEILDDAAALAGAAADRLAAWLGKAVAARGRASLVLAGGETPIATYRRLALHRLPWEAIDLYWGDERCVPPDDAQSNYARARDSLLVPAGVPEERVHRIRGELGPRRASGDYERRLRRRFRGRRPRFDVVLLGVGEDGHTASLFTAELGSASPRWVVATRSPAPPHERVSLAFEALRGAERTVFLVAGAGKAATVERLLGSPEVALPAARVAREARRPFWLLDRAAAARLAT